MAKEKKTLVSEKITRNVTVGKDGRPVMSSKLVTRDYEKGDCDYTETIAEHGELSDGTIASSKEMYGSKAQGGIQLKRCDACYENSQTFLTWLFHRNQPVNVYSPVSTSRRCYNCRKNFCEKHYVLIGGHIRCKACARRYHWVNFLVQRILRPIFFRKVNP